MRREIEALCNGSSSGGGGNGNTTCGNSDPGRFQSWWGQWRAKHGLHDTKVRLHVVTCACLCHCTCVFVFACVLVRLEVCASFQLVFSWGFDFL